MHACMHTYYIVFSPELGCSRSAGRLGEQVSAQGLAWSVRHVERQHGVFTVPQKSQVGGSVGKRIRSKVS